MPASHALAAPSAGVFRVARSIEVFSFRMPEPLSVPALFPVEAGNRWDDPEGRFATLSAPRAPRAHSVK